MLNKLIKLANHFDSLGRHDLADQLDEIVKSASVLNARSNLIKALKDDNAKAANDAIMELMSNVPRGSNAADELGIPSQDFKDIANAIHDGDLEKARKLFGVGKTPGADTNKINPFTGQPWPSGEVKETGSKSNKPSGSGAKNTKYEFTGVEQSSRGFGGVKVKQIRRLSDGKVGGFIESEANLSFDGDCFVYDNAMVYNDAVVKDSAGVRDRAAVFGDAVVSEGAEVAGMASVHKNALISGTAYIGQAAEVTEDAVVTDRAIVDGNAVVGGSAHITGGAIITGTAKVFIDVDAGTIDSGSHV